MIAQCTTFSLRYTGPGARHGSLTAHHGSHIIGNRLTLCKEGESLVQVSISEGESFDSLLRRFTKKVQQDGILSEARRREHFEPPSIKRKKKAAAKRRKSSRR